MSRDCTNGYLYDSTMVLKVMGYMGYEEFYEKIKEKSCVVKLIGDEYKDARGVLLKNLSGNEIWK